MANASNYYIGANDEHGLNPPTPGKRSPIISYLGRSIYENEFNKDAKSYFIQACLRVGFRVYDVKPEVQDISVSQRIVRINRQGLNALVTFAYNAYGNEFNSGQGFEMFYSTYNVNPAQSRNLSQQIFNKLQTNTARKARGVSILNTASILNKVNCLSTLLEAGFMTNLVEARLMLDPDYQLVVGESACQGVCAYYNVPYISRSSTSTYPTLRVGSRNNYVRLMQNILANYGYTISQDGIFGLNTAKTITDFQRRNNLTTDGIIGPATWSALLSLDPTRRTVRTGDNNASVYYLQRKLLSKLYPVGTIDGRFGNATLSAVRQYQAENGLTVDGIVGPATWRKVAELGTGRSV